MQEVWKDVLNYETLFMVSNTGKLLSKRTGKILKQHLNSHGYHTVATKIGGKSGTNKCFKIHRLVAEVFCDNPEGKQIVNHKDGIKQNNNFNNLEWVTNAENIQHAYDTGLIKIVTGFDHPLNKISKEEAIKVLKFHQEGLSERKISAITGFGRGAIRTAIRNLKN